MARTGRFDGSTTVWVAAVVAMLATTAMATSPAHASATDDSFASALDVEDEQPVTWPTFYEELNKQAPPQVCAPYAWTASVLTMSTPTVSAPLPPAIATGLFMLAGNWVVTHLWKKRKI